MKFLNFLFTGANFIISKYLNSLKSVADKNNNLIHFCRQDQTKTMTVFWDLFL